MTSSLTKRVTLTITFALAAFSMQAHADDHDEEYIVTENDQDYESCVSNRSYCVVFEKGKPTSITNQENQKTIYLEGYDKVDDYEWTWEDGIFAVLKDDKVGYMNIDGQLVVPTIYDNLIDANNDYDETWSNAMYEGHVVVKKDGRYGIIDKQNNTILPFDNNYQFIGTLKEGRAPVLLSAGVANAGKWGFIDKNGKQVIAPEYNDVNKSVVRPYGFFQGFTGVKKGNKWGYINTSGHVIMPFIYDAVRPFGGGLAGVRQGDKWGFIDSANNIVIPFQYLESNVKRNQDNYMGANYFDFFDSELAQVPTSNGKIACINKSGKDVSCSESADNDVDADYDASEVCADLLGETIDCSAIEEEIAE